MNAFTIAAFASALIAVARPGFADTFPVDCSHDQMCIAEMVHDKTPAGDVRVADQGFTPGLDEPPAGTESVWIPKGTLFPVQTMQSYSSYGAGVGAKIRYELTADVIVHDRIVAMKGDTAEGRVQSAMTGGGYFFTGTRGADLRVSVDRVFSFCGDTIDVDFDRSEFRLRRLGMMVADVDVHIIRGQTYTAFSDRPQHACGLKTNEAPSSQSQNSLWTTTH